MITHLFRKKCQQPNEPLVPDVGLICRKQVETINARRPRHVNIPPNSLPSNQGSDDNMPGPAPQSSGSDIEMRDRPYDSDSDEIDHPDEEQPADWQDPTETLDVDPSFHPGLNRVYAEIQVLRLTSIITQHCL